VPASPTAACVAAAQTSVQCTSRARAEQLARSAGQASARSSSRQPGRAAHSTWVSSAAGALGVAARGAAGLVGVAGTPCDSAGERVARSGAVIVVHAPFNAAAAHTRERSSHGWNFPARSRIMAASIALAARIHGSRLAAARSGRCARVVARNRLVDVAAALGPASTGAVRLLQRDQAKPAACERRHVLHHPHVRHGFENVFEHDIRACGDARGDRIQ